MVISCTTELSTIPTEAAKLYRPNRPIAEKCFQQMLDGVFFRLESAQATFPPSFAVINLPRSIGGPVQNERLIGQPSGQRISVRIDPQRCQMRFQLSQIHRAEFPPQKSRQQE